MIKNVQDIIIKLDQVFGSEEKVKLLNEADNYGFCLVHYFCAIGYHEVVYILGDHNIDINVKTRDCQRTPLILASESGHELTVKAILDVSNKQEIQRQNRVRQIIKNNSEAKRVAIVLKDEGKAPPNDIDSNSCQQSENSEIDQIDINEMNAINGLEQQKNQAFEVAIQKRQYTVAECILRDISLKEAVQKGVKHEKSLQITFKDDIPVLRRQNSFTFEDDDHLLEIKETDFNDAASAKERRQVNFQQKQELLKIRRKFNIQNFDKKCLLKIQKL